MVFLWRNFLRDLFFDMAASDYLIAHNINFDKNVISAEFIRYQVKPRSKLIKLCTMQESTDYCKIKNKWGGYKWPSLIELHNHLFGEDFDGAHDALADVKACAKSFFELKKRAIMLKPLPELHDLKIWPEYFNAVKSGDKKFEIRKNDRSFKVGDTLNLKEFDPEKKDYTDREVRRKISFILEGGSHGVEKDYVIMSIKPV